MKSIVKILARLYPASWRARYGAEFDALLEEVPPSTRQALGVFLGAMSMQITTWNFGKIVAVSAVAGLALASVGAFLRPAEYDSSTKVEIYGGDDASQASVDNLVKSNLSRESLAAIIQRHNLYPRERGHESTDQLVTRMREAITVHSFRANPPVRNVTLDFSYPDPKVAQDVNADLVQKIMRSNFEMDIAYHGGPHLMAVLPGPTSLPPQPYEPDLYDSSTNFEIYGSDNSALSLIDTLFKSALSRESLAAIIQRHNLYPVERLHESSDELVARMEKAIAINSARANSPDAPGMRNLTLDFNYSDPKVAQEVDGELVSQLVAGNLTMREASPAGPPMQFHVPEAPSLPNKPTGPGLGFVSAGGATAGAICGLGLATLMWFRRKRRVGAP